MKRALAIAGATLSAIGAVAPIASATVGDPNGTPAPAMPKEPKGEHCGATTTNTGFAAGMDEIFVGVPNCAVKGTKDVLTGLTSLLNEEKDQS